MKSVKKTQYLE